jgi:teichuronic acid exporter
MSIKKATISNIKWSFIESISMQIISFLLSIILARLLLPSDFGILAVVNVFYLLVNTFIDGGLKEALIQKKEASDEDYSTVYWTNLIISSLLYLVLFTAAPFIEDFYHYKDLAFYIRIQSLCLFLDSFNVIQLVRATRELKLKKITKARIPAAIISLIVGVLLAYSGFGIMSLIIMQIIQSLIYTSLLLYRTEYFPRPIIKIESLKILYGYGFKLFISGYINRIFTQGMSLIFAKYYSAATLGLYTRSRNLQGLPSNIITDTFVKGSYPTMVILQNNHEALRKVYHGSLQILVIITSLLSVLLFFQAESIVFFLFGEKWIGMTPLLEIVSIGTVFNAISSLSKNVLKAVGAVNLYFKLELINKITSILVIIIMVRYSFSIMLFTVVMYNVAFRFLELYLAGRLIEYRFIKQMKLIFGYLILSIFSGLISNMIISYLSFDYILIKLFVFGIVVLVLNVSLLYLVDKEIFKSTRKIVMFEKLVNSLLILFNKKYKVGRWYNYKENWGDGINPVLVQALYGKKMVHINTVFNIFRLPVYSCVGSIINVFPKNKRIIIWGSGVANPDLPLKFIPKDVRAVRGPLTLEYLKKHGVSCNPVFGDPVLLLRRIYDPTNIVKKYKYGVICHYEDITPELDNGIATCETILNIKIIQDLTDPYQIINQVLSCEKIVSSSLHGLILADLYEVPNSWIFFNNFEKSTFKFFDYYQSLNVHTNKPHIIEESKLIENLENLDFKINKITLDLDLLYNSSPFKN